MSFIKNIPKITLTNSKDKNYKYLSSREKTYRLDNLIIIGKIVILSEYINENINKNINKNITKNKENSKELFDIIKYLKDEKVIKNYNSDLDYKTFKKKNKLYTYFSEKGKSYWRNQNKKKIKEIYSLECKKLDLKENYFLNKKELLEYCFTKPSYGNIYKTNNKYFISNSCKSNMETGIRLSPSKDLSVYECIFNMFSIKQEDDYYEDLPYYFKKYRNENICFIINDIILLKKINNNSILLRLFMYILKDGLEEIFGSEKENSCKVIQKNWRIWKNKLLLTI